MRPKTVDTGRHQRLIDDLEAHARADGRVRAAWLEGSFAAGTADAASDIDLHLALADDDVDAFIADARGWIAEVREPIGFLPLTFGPRRMFGCSLNDWLRLDLFVEPVSSVADPVRPLAPLVLFDRERLTAQLRVDTEAALDPAARLTEIVRTLLFGFTFPARLSLREEWGSLHLNALLVVYQFIVPAMIAQRRPLDAFRPQLHNERFLDEDQRERVDGLVVELARAFSTRPPDAMAVRTAHANLETMLLNELPAAARLHQVEWPAEAEQSMRLFLREELGVETG